MLASSWVVTEEASYFKRLGYTWVDSRESKRGEAWGGEIE